MSDLFKITILFTAILPSCISGGKQEAGGEWIRDNELQKLQIIEDQFRGFDLAMVETSYRYQELYQAGKDQNWDYANYQVEKIRKASENGLQRRPKRAESAAHFLNQTLPEMKKAVGSRDTTEFLRDFKVLTAGCNACHAKEKVPFFSVQTFSSRQSPIKFNKQN